MDPPLIGGTTGEFCFTGPPTAFCFVGPPTELCAKAGWALPNAPRIMTMTSAPFFMDASFHAALGPEVDVVYSNV